MEVEVKNFYPLPNERDDHQGYVKGSLHVAVQIGDVELNIRGVLACKKGGQWFFHLPSKIGIDHRTGQSVKYPILSFGLDSPLNKVLLDGIYEKGPVAVEAFLLSHPEIDAAFQQEGSQKANTAPPAAQKLMSRGDVASATQKTYNKPKIFCDPPIRKIASQMNRNNS
jgi:hypothetical protein